MENKSRRPEDCFRMDAAEFLKLKNAGNLIATYHSHPASDHLPSGADIENAEALELPSYIYGLSNGVLGCYVPKSYPARRLTGRTFIPLINDCISLAWDYYREHGVELPFVARTQDDYADGAAFNWRALVTQVGAAFVSEERAGDLLLMATMNARDVNHAGVYLGNGRMLHQPGGKPSEIAVWIGFWQRNTRFRIRIPGVKA